MIVQVGGAIGGWWTAGLLVADSILGAWLLRVEGRRAWSQFRTALQEGRWPGDEVAQGALIIVGGTLLLTPGFLTDGLGFLFLVAPTRRWVSRRLRSRVSEQMVGGAASGGPASGGPASGGTASGGPRTGGAATRGPGPRRPASGAEGDELHLDVEVVEIRREQGPRPVSPGEDEDASTSDTDGRG